MTSSVICRRLWRSDSGYETALLMTNNLTTQSVKVLVGGVTARKNAGLFNNLEYLPLFHLHSRLLNHCRYNH